MKIRVYRFRLRGPRLIVLRWLDDLLNSRILAYKRLIPPKAGFFLIIILAIAFMIPARIIDPMPVQADAGIMRWDVINTPGFFVDRFDILSPSDIIHMAAGKNGRVVAIARVPEPASPNLSQNLIYHSNNNGASWINTAFNNLSTFWADNEMYHVAIAPDNPDVWAVTYGIAAEGYAPQRFHM